MELPHLLPPLATPGDVITFHSHKGGAGRSTAVANIATLLAGRRHGTMPTLAIDWDLEAPGLHQFFAPAPDGPGVLEFFTACRDMLLQRRRGRGSAGTGKGGSGQRRHDNGGGAICAGADGAASLDGGAADDAEEARQVLAAVGWERYVVRADQSRPLYLMRAGRLDAGYAGRVAAFDWEALFHACPALFRCFAAMLARHFGHVLVDARSGRTDTAGICTTLLPTRLVLLFEANRQSLEGLQSLVQRATTYRRSHEDEQRPLLVYPLPTRCDMECSAHRARCRHGDPATGLPGYQSVFEQALSEAYGVQQLSLDSYFDEVQLPQSRSLARGERRVVRGEAVADRFSATRACEALLGWLEGGHPPWRSACELPLLAAVRQSRRLLEEGGAYGMMLARDLFRLGTLYADEGRRAAAMLALRESLELHARLLGEEDLETAAARAGLARVLLREGELEQARQLLRRVADTRLRLLGGEHPDVLETWSAQACTLARQGHADAALDRQDDVLRVQMRLLGPEHADTLASQAARGAIHFMCGNLDAARQAQEQVLALRARLLGDEHPATLEVALALTRTLDRIGGLAAGGALPPSADNAPPADGAAAGVEQDVLPYHGLERHHAAPAGVRRHAVPQPERMPNAPVAPG